MAAGTGCTPRSFRSFHVPEWVVRWIVVASVIGLPPFIAFAWYYEFTPEGLKRQSEVDLEESIVHLTARKLDRWIIVLLVFIALLMVVQVFVAQTRGQGAPHAGAADAVQAKSIAVLPFENLSARMRTTPTSRPACRMKSSRAWPGFATSR